jgi:hypothetical protein
MVSFWIRHDNYSQGRECSVLSEGDVSIRFSWERVKVVASFVYLLSVSAFCLESEVQATSAVSPDLKFRMPSLGIISVYLPPVYFKKTGSLKVLAPVLLRSVLMSIVHSKIYLLILMEFR